MSDPVADLFRAMANAWDEGYAKALTDDGNTIESSGYHLRVNPYAAALDKITVTCELIPASQKKQRGEEAVPLPVDAQSTHAGEGERLCDVCHRPCVWLSLGHWAHLPSGEWQEPRHEAKVTRWR